jgi:hypothetical protein
MKEAHMKKYHLLELKNFDFSTEAWRERFGVPKALSLDYVQKLRDKTTESTGKFFVVKFCSNMDFNTFFLR